MELGAWLKTSESLDLSRTGMPTSMPTSQSLACQSAGPLVEYPEAAKHRFPSAPGVRLLQV